MEKTKVQKCMFDPKPKAMNPMLNETHALPVCGKVRCAAVCCNSPGCEGFYYGMRKECMCVLMSNEEGTKISRKVEGNYGVWVKSM